MSERVSEATGKRVFYVSFPFFKHKVLKCAGMVGDADHERFYTAHFAKHGTHNRVNEGPFKVIIATYQGDRVIDPNDLPDEKEAAFIRQQIGPRPVLAL